MRKRAATNGVRAFESGERESRTRAEEKVPVRRKIVSIPGECNARSRGNGKSLNGEISFSRSNIWASPNEPRFLSAPFFRYTAFSTLPLFSARVRFINEHFTWMGVKGGREGERERGIRDEKWTKRGGAWNGKWKKEGRRERRREKGRVGVHFSPIKYHAPDRIELVITQSGRWSLVTWRLQASALPFLTFLIFLLLCSRDFSPPEEKPNFGNYRISGIRYLEYIVYSMYYVSYLDRNESFSEFLCTDVTNRITCVRIEICSTSE